MDKTRIRQGNKQATEKHKNIRRAKRKSLEDKIIEAEELTYQAGGF